VRGLNKIEANPSMFLLETRLQHRRRRDGGLRAFISWYLPFFAEFETLSSNRAVIPIPWVAPGSIIGLPLVLLCDSPPTLFSSMR